MRKSFTILCLLLVILGVEWGVKAKMPINRPSNIQEKEETPWYESRYSTPKADADWVLDEEIPVNYIPVPGKDNIYMQVDNNGNVKKYWKRTQQADGSWVWSKYDPNIPDNYEPVKGLKNVYKVTSRDGTIKYLKYIRNKDNSFAFVEVDKNGKSIDEGKSAESVPNNYKHISKDVYAVYDKNNVLTGYRKRVKNKKGKYIWKETDKPKTSSDDINAINKALTGDSATKAASSTSAQNNTSSNNEISAIGSDSSNQKRSNNSDGTYTVTETSQDTKVENGVRITYETTIQKIYKKDGTLLKTKKIGPQVINKETLTAADSPDKSKIKSTLDKELARVSSRVEFDTKKANDVLTKLNAQRKSEGLSSLSMDTSSEAYKLACIRAADMAIYDYSSSTSPMYGTLNDMCNLWKISSSHPSENIWKAPSKTADEIHSRFQSNDGSRKIRMSNGYSNVGIAVIEKNGNTYIAEIYLS